MDNDRIDMALEIDLIVEKDVHIIVAETEGIIRMAVIMVIGVTDPVMGITKQITGIMIGLIIEGKILTKIIVKEIETEVQAENVIGLGLDMEVLQEMIQEIDIEITKVGVETEDKGLEQIQETEGIDQDLDLAHVLEHIGTGQDVIGAINMTTLQENALTLCQMKNGMLFCSC